MNKQISSIIKDKATTTAPIEGTVSSPENGGAIKEARANMNITSPDNILKMRVLNIDAPR